MVFVDFRCCFILINLNMDEITVAGLKKQLRDLGEKVSGTKTVLLERLNNAQKKNATASSVIYVAGEATTVDGLRTLPTLPMCRLNTVQNDDEASVMNVAGKATTVDSLKIQLRAMGAKVSGNKSVLQERLKNWQENIVTRPLFEINVIEEDKENFPTNINPQPLENLDAKVLEWLTPPVIAYYFSERLATKGHDKGRKLFLCEFLKDVSFVETDGDVFIASKCSAETKKALFGFT
ncbi:hypothetical protein Bhyg_12264 [Pseudolycoriella hygida]|uniref:SAP domain-containing protein n=1 Tax=Pseudolycoriella hygida TaxID=35572 RepID=A0A9Q0MX11_9DIPT|nr:hypothetical protein Bhyg_12264 [Pseudolycoriella hygida]